MTMIWAHSGDSHFIEPPDLWGEILPAALAERMPRSEKISPTEEIVHVDGKSFHRDLPDIKRSTKRGSDGLTQVEKQQRARGIRDMSARLADLDEEGIWGEVIYPSLGLWENLIEDRELVKAAAAAQNEWRISKIQGAAPDRLISVATVPLHRVEDSVAEVHHAAELGFKVIGIPTGVPAGTKDWNYDDWEPLWAACEEAGMVLGVHTAPENGDVIPFRGPGGAVLNYTEATYAGQRIATKLVTSGVLDRHPNLRLLVSEAGASWVPFVGDRMNEAYRQHGSFVRPTLSRLPKEILFNQVFASFQHDETAIPTLTAMGYSNVLWGSDYPHTEGTFGHTQKTLHELFDDADPAVRERITTGTFEELFPHVKVPAGS